MIKEAFLLDNQLCFRLYTASRLLTQAYHPLLSAHGLTYPQYLVLLVLWEKDARQIIVSLSKKGKRLQEKLDEVPSTVGKAVICDSVIPKTEDTQFLQYGRDSIPVLFRMLDEMIAQLRSSLKKES